MDDGGRILLLQRVEYLPIPDTDVGRSSCSEAHGNALEGIRFDGRQGSLHRCPIPDSSGRMADPEILFDRRGGAGLVTLNRPKALNAVTLGMVRALARQLADWAADPGVTRVLVTAAGGRAFSAGGDIRALYELGQAGRFAEALVFWREEYALNRLIKLYPKPYVSLIDGIVMGGGVGLSVHGSHRVAGDAYAFAMPEVGIGFFPDVGATWFLPRLPRRTGTWLALTGDRIGAADALALGLATHRVASEQMAELREALTGNRPIDAVLAAFPGNGASAGRAEPPDCESLFAGAEVEDVLTRLDTVAASGSASAAFAARAAGAIRTKSPTSLKIALAQMQAGPQLDFDGCMKTEFRIVSRIVKGADFYEGVRAVIVDKDNAPRWRPDTLGGVAPAEVARYFAPLGPAELTFGGQVLA